MTKNLTAKQKKKRKKAIRRRRVLLLLLLVAIVVSICLFTPFFRVKTVEIKGNEHISSEQILETAAVPPEINIFRVSKRSIKKAVLKIPEIEAVKIRRILPAKLRVEVTETPAAMYFPYLTGFAVTNESGRVLSLADTEEDLNLLKITGLEIKNAEICKKISVQDTVTFDIIIDTIRGFSGAGILQEMRSCHFDNLSEIYAYLNDGTKIIFGKTANMEYKLSVLVKILKQVNRTEGAYIDLTTPERSVYGMLEPEEAESSPVPEETAANAEPSPAPEETAADAEPSPQPEEADGNDKKENQS